MKKINLLKMSIIISVITMFSCSKEAENVTVDFLENVTTHNVIEYKCWDLNHNGEADEEEDKNKDGKVDSNDCNQE